MPKMYQIGYTLKNFSGGETPGPPNFASGDCILGSGG